MKTPKTLLIDGSHYLERSWAVNVKSRSLENLEKNTLDMFLSLIVNDMVTMKTQGVLVAFDAKVSWRQKLNASHLTRRSLPQVAVEVNTGKKMMVGPTAGELTSKAITVCELAGIPVVHAKGYEAGDLIASACRCVPGRIFIAAKRMDIAQLARQRISLWWSAEKLILKQEKQHEDIRGKFKLSAYQIPDYLALAGDQSLFIPGIGLDDDTAMKLINKYDSISNMKKNEKLAAKLEKRQAKLSLSLDMATMKSDYDINKSQIILGPVNEEVAKYVWRVPQALAKMHDH